VASESEPTVDRSIAGPVDARVVVSTRAQLLAWERALRRGARRVGWKVALDFPEIAAVIGDRPVVGHLTSETVLASGSAFSIATARAPRVETELVIEMGAAVEPGMTERQIQDAVAGMATGLEIVDVGRPPHDLEGIIAGNVAHRACVIGVTRRDPWQPNATAKTVVNGEIREATRLDGNHVKRLAEMARILAAVGLHLDAGDRVLSGSSTHVEAAAGDHVASEIEGLGSVDVRLIA
jgi:2-keto-4-pentenoate hydratase